MLGGRPFSLILGEVTQAPNYRALWRMFWRYPGPTKNLGRYFFGWGTYPWRCRVRTPCGEVAPTLYSHHDMWTVNEVFCREDYAAGPELRVFVDVGSNIGMSALYFLTRNYTSRGYLFEPVPKNIERLRANLAGYERRYGIREAAVSERSGTATFGVEETGRYGGIGAQTGRSIEVESLAVNEVLGEILERERAIDVLKVDTEGLELATVRAISPELLRKIRTIYLEVEEEPELHPELFERSFANTTCALRSRLHPAHGRAA